MLDGPTTEEIFDSLIKFAFSATAAAEFGTALYALLVDPDRAGAGLWLEVVIPDLLGLAASESGDERL